MLIDTRVKTFLTLVETLNYTHTAKMLNLSQPAVTKHIQTLEEDLQTSLVEYKNRKVHLTDKARELLPYLDELVKLNQTATEIAHKESKKIIIHLGVCLTLGNYFINQIIERFCDIYPDVELIIHIKNSAKLEEMLGKNKIDLVLLLSPVHHPNFFIRHLKEENMVFIASGDNPLLTKTCSIQDLQNEKIFLREEGSGTLDIFRSTLAETGLELSDFSSLKSIGSNELIKQLVYKGNGIAPIYERAVEKELAEGSLKKLAIKNFKLSYPLTILTPKNVQLSEPVQFLIDRIINVE